MNTVCIIVGGWLLALAGSTQAILSKILDEKGQIDLDALTAVTHTCAGEKVNLDSWEKIYNGECKPKGRGTKVGAQDLLCAAACFYKKIGLMDAGGKLLSNEEAVKGALIKSGVNAGLAGKFAPGMAKCGATAGKIDETQCMNSLPFLICYIAVHQQACAPPK